MASKVEIVSSSKDNASITFCFHKEDHTIGNALRHIVMKDPAVEFCGYSVPHPTEDKIHFRIQTTGESAVDVLNRGLDNLANVCQHILEVTEKEI